MYGSWDAGTWAWMVLVMLLFVGVLAFGILAVVRSSIGMGSRDAARVQRSSRRFGQPVRPGRIDTEEYAERRRILTEANDPAHV